MSHYDYFASEILLSDSISMFYDKMVKMFMCKSVHKTSHIHFPYNGFNAAFELINNELIEGKFPIKQARLI